MQQRANARGDRADKEALPVLFGQNDVVGQTGGKGLQTDNGTEWTTALLTKNPGHKTLFEQYLEEHGIIYHRIRVATPRHNGKVERQHRIDEVRFYSRLRMYGLADGRKQMKTYNKKSNNISKSCLKYRSPNAVLRDYLGAM